MLIAAEHISKLYSDQPVLRDCSCYLTEGAKVGIIGRNGSGKTTLLRIMAGDELPDSGTVTIHGALRIGFLPQDPVLDPDQSILEAVLAYGAKDRHKPEEYEAKQVLTRLGFSDFEENTGHLSGGQKKRVALAGVLVTPCDVLILDEPTNHLDNEMITWLEQFLRSYKGALVMITHDRYFLERIVSEIWELHRGSLYAYPANYSKYLELKAQREEMAQSTERKRQSLLKKELAWIRQGPQGRGTKSQFRIDRFQELSAQDGPAQDSKIEISSLSTRLGKKIVEIDAISKAFDGQVLLRDFSHMVTRDARIGIVGPNGSGKSTLIRIIAGLITPDSGSVLYGDTVKLGYFSQDSSEMPPEMRVIDYIKEFGNYIDTVDGKISASQLLETFLFPPEVQWNRIERLSGGERRRLLLLGVLAGAPNVLLLDEPTNDLDVETLTLLEDYLESFPGAVLVVSHDRYFLDKVCDQIFAFPGNGQVEKHLGTYADYLQHRTAPAEITSTPKSIKGPQQKQATKEKRLRLSYQDQRDFDSIQDDIAALENALKALELEIQQHASDYEKLEALLARQSQLEQNLDERYERWLSLQELVEAIEKQGRG